MILMTEKMFVPADNDVLREKYEPRYGVCGISVIAVLEKKTVSEILEDWITDYRGYAPVKEMKKMLQKLGYKCSLKRGKKARKFPEPATDIAVIRIQFLDENGKEFFWAEATLHSHYVLMQKVNGKWWIFCNGDAKWFAKDSVTAKKYLKDCYVSSYLELTK